MTVERNPLTEARHLRELADEMIAEADRAGREPSEMAVVLSPYGRGAMWHAEARGLARGYLLGRVMAAADVRLGLDQSFANGSVHFDSDVEPPPQWLMRTAEKLARGDA